VLGEWPKKEEEGSRADSVYEQWKRKKLNPVAEVTPMDRVIANNTTFYKEDYVMKVQADLDGKLRNSQQQLSQLEYD